MLEPADVGYEFIEWPLHITIVPWFPCDDEKKLDAILEEIAGNHPVFSVTVGPAEWFGPKKDVPVNLVEASPALMALHIAVFEALEKNNFPIHQKEFVGAGYRAHITHQKHGQKHPRQILRLKSFTLVKQLRMKKTGAMVKTITKNYELAG